MSLRPHFVLRHKAPNDRNGNARRVYVLYSFGARIMGVWDEGSLGSSALPFDYRLYPCVDVPCSATEYRTLLKTTPVTEG